MCEILCMVNTLRGRYEFWAVSEDSILVYCTLPSHPSLLSKVQTSFSVRWVRIKCIHKFILWVNWSGFDTFCPIFPGAHCQVRLPWFTLAKSVRLPILWADKMFRTFHASDIFHGDIVAESFYELGPEGNSRRGHIVYNRPPTNSSNSLQHKSS